MTSMAPHYSVGQVGMRQMARPDELGIGVTFSPDASGLRRGVPTAPAWHLGAMAMGERYGAA
jgi:hypothetical protein